jgi:DNA-binding NarL/FixJ family response regulator
MIRSTQPGAGKRGAAAPAVRSVLTVELALGDPDLAQRVRDMLTERAGFGVAGADDAHKPEVMIVDASTSWADRRAEDVPVLALADGADAVAALYTGATAVLPADTDARALRAAVRAAALGLTTLAPELRQHLLGDLGEVVGRPDSADDLEVPAPSLTVREMEVLRLLAEGASNKAIARSLGITPHTAKFHVAAIAAKLGAAGRTDAVARAVSLGLVMV